MEGVGMEDGGEICKAKAEPGRAIGLQMIGGFVNEVKEEGESFHPYRSGHT